MSEKTIILEDCSPSSVSDLSKDIDLTDDLSKHSDAGPEDGYLNATMKVEKKQKNRKKNCNPTVQCLWGILLILLSISSLIFTPFDLLLWEKLNMRQGMPPYEWWADPPDEVKLRVYVFNVTNHERFMKGIDKKLNVEEIGPIVYLEKLLHSNVTFNDNSTMTYTAKRFPIFLPEENNIDLNGTLIVPNIAVLGIFSYLHDANYLVRTVVRSFVNIHLSKPFVHKTIYDYLWNFSDPVLDMSKNLVPNLVPVNNVGMLTRVYSDFTDQVTVKIGQQWGHKNFFQIDRFNGHPQLPGYDPDECPDRIFGSTEGVMYAQRLTKQDVPLYWRKTVCKLMPLYFDTELTADSVPLYRYNLSESVFERIKNNTDCYDTVPSLPPGLSDASKCYYDFPMVVSYPHFYTGGVPKDQYVTGLKPDKDKHNSFIKVEPFTGTPFESVARMQSNLRMYDISAYNNDFAKLSNLVLPLFWAEYHQEGLPAHIKNMVYFIVVVLPPISILMSTVILLCGLYLISKHMFKNKLNNKLKTILLFKDKSVAQSKLFTFEKESFLKPR